MFKKVFISYATEDFKYAEKLYKFLELNGFQPWMDKLKLLPGQNWDFIIQQELRKADFIIILLSEISVSKRGYVQKEFSQALLYCDEKLDSDIFIIPILINSCEVPAKLSKFQWVEYSSDDTFEKILLSIDIQRELLIKEKKQREASVSGLSYKEKSIVGEYGERSPKQLYEITFPEFSNQHSESLHELNITIESEALDYLKRARSNFFEYLKDANDETFLMDSDSTLYGQFAFQHLSQEFISYTSFWSLYETGAAHGNYWTIGHNYYANPVRKMELKSLFTDFNKALPIIRDMVHEKLMNKAKNEMEIHEASDFYLFEEGLEVKEENFENFYFKHNSIVFIYNPYHLTAYALGDHHPEITYDELIGNFQDEKKLIDFIKMIKIEEK